jgi:hypothetical protein
MTDPPWIDALLGLGLLVGGIALFRSRSRFVEYTYRQQVKYLGRLMKEPREDDANGWKMVVPAVAAVAIGIGLLISGLSRI